MGTGAAAALAAGTDGALRFSCQEARASALGDACRRAWGGAAVRAVCLSCLPRASAQQRQ